MTKHSFSKSTISNISKFSIDKNYFYFIIPTLILYTIIKITFDILGWKENILYYFPSYISIKSINIPNFIHILKLSTICFFSFFLPSIIIRFCIGVILIKSQLKVQRFLSFLITIIFIFTTKNDGFSFGFNNTNSEWILNLSKFINVLFIGFIIISVIILFVNINEKNTNRKIRIIFMFILITIYLIYDWKKTSDFRNETRINIEKTELIFIIDRTNEKDVSQLKNTSDFKYIKDNFKIHENKISLVSNNDITNYSSLLTGLMPFESGIRNEIPSNSSIQYVKNFIETHRRNNKFIYISNIGNPSSIGGFTKNFDDGVICDNDLKSIYKYSMIENLNPFLVFLPSSIILNIIPSALCLEKSSDTNQNILFDLYKGINTKTEKNKLLVSFLNKKIGEFNILKIIEKLNETLETDKMKVKIVFLDSTSLYSEIINLNKINLIEKEYISINQIGESEIMNYPKNEKYEYQEKNGDNNSKRIAEIIDDRASYNLNDSIIYSMNLKRKYGCYNSEKQLTSSSYYEKISNDLPQKIMIKKNPLFNSDSCEKIIENSFTNDSSLILSDNLFKKIFVFISDKP